MRSRTGWVMTAGLCVWVVIVSCFLQAADRAGDNTGARSAAKEGDKSSGKTGNQAGTTTTPLVPDSVDKDYKDELPRFPGLSPTEALKSFRTLPGFRLEQVAAEPLVHSPVAISFDEQGRMFVVEMIDYSEQDQESLGAVRMLEDTDGDGKYDKSTVYADKLSWPTAVTCYDGGVFVGAAPHLYYFKDTDGDGRADVKELVYTGFSRVNVQGMFNSFHWGLDNRIHGATSSNGGQIQPVQAGKVASHQPLTINGRNFAFDPKTRVFNVTSGAAQHGMSFDDYGRRFVCSNSDHLQLVMFEDRYLARNPYLVAPSPRISIAADGPQAEVFRISPVEPWRIVRTRLRVSGVVKGMVEGGGRAAGYFTGATGATIYRGDAWPAEYRGQAFIGDVGSNIVHRKVLEAKGVELVGKRVDEKKEFVASTDTWFRPAQFANGPDGNLYVIDVYREVIEHPASIPPMIKKHLDLTSGRDRGRVYRIVRDEYAHKKFVPLSKQNPSALVGALWHKNGWHVDTAARLLYELQDTSVVPLLEQLARNAQAPDTGRIHALWTLQGLKSLTAEIVLHALQDASPRVREQGLKLAEGFLKSGPEAKSSALASALSERIQKAVEDPDLLVRYQAAFTLGELPASQQGTAAALAKSLRLNGSDRWLRLAAMSSITPHVGAVVSELVRDQAYRATPAGRELIEQLALQVGTQQPQEQGVVAVLQLINELPDDEKLLATVLARGLRDGLSKRGTTGWRELFATHSKTALELLDAQQVTAREVALNDKRTLADRLEAVRTLGTGTLKDNAATLSQLLTGRQPQDIQLAAITALGRFNDVAAAKTLIGAWAGFSPRVRGAVTEVVFSRKEWLHVYLDAVEKETIPLGDVEPTRVKLLTVSNDEALRNRGKALSAKLAVGRRGDVLEAYKPALSRQGDPAKGKQIFAKVCAACHKAEGVGHEIGPNLATLQNRGAEAILLNVLDPNREVNPQYVNYIVVTNAGLTVTGMIAAETATSLTMKRAENATDTVLRINIDELLSTGLSIMPEGLEKTIDVPAMADLIAYVLSLK